MNRNTGMNGQQVMSLDIAKQVFQLHTVDMGMGEIVNMQIKRARVLAHAKEPSPWLENIKQRRPANVAIVTQATKMAGTVWAVTAKQQDFQRGFQSVRPQVA